jgi:hypothetical protein
MMIGEKKPNPIKYAKVCATAQKDRGYHDDYINNMM